MSKAELSPFTPGQPVPPELFTGRQHEVEELSAYAEAAAHGRLQVAFLSGERGIGKSSIASFVRLMSQHRYNLVSVQAFMGGANSVEEMVRRVFDRIVKVGQDKTWFDKVRDLFDRHIHTVDVFGVRVGFQPSKADLEKLTDNFDIALHTLIEKLKPEKTGFFIVLDDINGLASSLEFAHWIKSFVDSVATAHTTLPLFVLLVGLEDRRRDLINLQPSLSRIFHLVEIKPWSTAESREFYRRAFKAAEIAVDDDALEYMIKYAGGLPMLAHEIGDAAFRLDDDGRISAEDALAAVISAADIVGRKHVEPKVFEAIRSKLYLRILQKIPLNLGEVFKRSDLLEHLDEAEASVLDNFLRKMRDIGVLAQDSHGPGWYHFTSSLFFVYFLSEAVRSRTRQE